MMKFSLDQLTAFVTTVEQGSFKQAALLLGKHATTISQQVATLEVDIDIQLFERHVRKLAPTQAGLEFYQFARPVLIEAGVLESKIDTMHAKLPSELRIALDSTIHDRQLLRCIKQVTQQYPHLAIEVHSGEPEQIIELVTSNQVDLGVITTLFKPFEGIISQPLFNFELIFIGAPSWVGCDEVKVQEQLKSCPQLVYRYVTQNSNLHGHILSYHYHSVANLADLIEMVSLGMGWAIVPRFQVETYLEQGDVTEFVVSGGKSVSWYSELIYASDKQLNPAMQRFIELALTLSDR
ncbi:LysR family transcriptional regulator [Shewanella maritima]|uniref:LysR family transcriptional regulator n=1 Tax=Shewanella maritima TaxID=2520507 RepID=A0A411PHF3_9GAMM|nr:LysR family transcriptional regulator [Shewanella maritima]QBF83041.1 LysR family transcriptional regulator [Shewanella maritima]